MAGIDLAEHRRQVEGYLREREAYVVFAQALKRVLEAGCLGAFPQALVQARAKDVSSFAEKAARKLDKYRDPLHQLTDLCGGRVTVQTLEQVKAVRAFIEANFAVLEQDDKSAGLAEDRFGYRDVHYIVQLRKDRDLGISPRERELIGTRKAEIQIRTWVQHAWADALHDRMYKTRLRLSAEMKRTGNLLAAVLEEGDRTLDGLAGEVDGMLANYSAHAPREDVEKEVAIIKAVLANLPDDARDEERVTLKLRLARLVAKAWGDHGYVVELLEPLAATGCGDLLRWDLLTELGFSLCKAEQAAGSGERFRRGQGMLEQVVKGTLTPGLVVDARKARGARARAWMRLGWTRAVAGAEPQEIAACYLAALELEPENPYYLVELLELERGAAARGDGGASGQLAIGRALQTCRAHAVAGIEMPHACFAAGRLSLLKGDGDRALGWYARGLCHRRQESACVPELLVQEQFAHVSRASGKKEPWNEVTVLLGLAEVARGRWEKERLRQFYAAPPVTLALPVVIVAGGASSLPSDLLEPVTQMLVEALSGFTGTVISGGTTVGVPGCMGAAAALLAAAGRKQFELVGYVPEQLADAIQDARYDRLIRWGREFSTAQVVGMWADMLLSGAAAQDVRLLGAGGGGIASLEYRIALALGATVGVLPETGGAADAILKDPLWSAEGKLLPLPADGMTVRALVRGAGGGAKGLSTDLVEAMGQQFHERHLARRIQQAPENLRAWNELDETYKRASREQARYALEILEAGGFGVRPAVGVPAPFAGFAPEELERMAALEHGRWNVERLSAGWRPGAARDNARKVHHLIVAWSDRVLDPFREDDFDSVRALPEMLARAGLEVYRKGGAN